jgi:hypothetical protein
MFRLMRNIHLGLGLIFFLMALVFAVSSLVIMYRPWLNTSASETQSESKVQLSPEAAGSPRAAAGELMARHGIKGELRQIQERGTSVSFRIVRPGGVAEVQYDRSSREANVRVRRQGALETLVQLHTNHGLWHDYMPSNIWAGISLFASVGLLLLGVSGIYLWFTHNNERVIGGALLGFGLIYGFVTLLLTRLEQ